MRKNSSIPHCVKYGKQRNQHGDFLIEAIVAVLVSGIIGMAMMQMYVQVRRVGNISQGEYVAAALAQEIMDHLRSLPFQTVDDNRGLHQPMVNGAGTPADILFPRALLQDTQPYNHTGNGNISLDYTQNGDTAVSQGQFNVLRTCTPAGALTNTIDVNITRLNIDSLNIQITINFLDSNARPRNYVCNGMLTRRGLTG
ncbi:MAG: hypothetical protein K2X77_10020 [Candidatus Obscuribacterales bacterium]|nr:hypothetical protein [Candidatus Obscuribacterales bacterium]